MGTTDTEVSTKLQSPTTGNNLTTTPNVENNSALNVEILKKQGIKTDPIMAKNRKVHI